MNAYDAVALFSGGLDSLLAARLVLEQGLKVKCLHFVSPFFGKAELVPRWSATFGLDIDVADVGESICRILDKGPPHGFGKTLNPCMDCKILMLREAKARMAAYGARCIISGEVLGQRPMSQRRDCLHRILREADVKDLLVRPLCAKLLPPSAVENAGLVDREKLCAIWGRGRKEQLALAARLALTETPAPAGGCKLTEREKVRRYWAVLRHAPTPRAEEFYLADAGRFFMSAEGRGPYMLFVGRTEPDNALLARRAFAEDILLETVDFPGPLAVGRQYHPWPEEVVADAAAFTASFSPKAVRRGDTIRVRAECGGRVRELEIQPARKTLLAWDVLSWDTVRGEIRAREKERSVQSAAEEGNF